MAIHGAYAKTQGDRMGDLAKHNINIMSVTDKYIYIEFQFKMRDGRPKWCRSVYERRGSSPQLEDEIETLMYAVKMARRRAEAYDAIAEEDNAYGC